MTKHYSLIFLFSLILFSCGTKEVVTEIVEVPAIRASYIYRADSVLSYAEINKENHKGLSDSYEQKSLSAQSTDMDKAIYYCKRAITLHPTFELYNTLGSLLQKGKYYGEAHDLYFFLVNKHYVATKQESIYVFQEPTDEMRYELIALSFLKYGYIDNYAIYEYKEDGHDIKKLEGRLLADGRLKIDTTLNQFNNFKLMFMTDAEIDEYKNSEQVFNGFLNSVTDTSSIFEINAKQVQNFKYNNRESDEMGEEWTMNDFYQNFLIEKKENPESWFRYNFNHVYSLNNSITVLVYSVDTSETGCPKEMRHIYHRIVLYNNTAHVIDNKIIAFQSGEDLATATVTQSDITVKFFKRKWRNSYQKKDFDNDLLSVEEAGSVSYKMNAEGKIEQQGNQTETLPSTL
ncbi:MAG: hypothetical protein H7282_16010 [Cytophagaceae bacterium]|nr:hypothetical protein [Cytophagaceae bacterium]